MKRSDFFYGKPGFVEQLREEKQKKKQESLQKAKSVNSLKSGDPKSGHNVHFEKDGASNEFFMDV